MAEDVCECWEDLEKSEVLDKKLQQLGLRADCKSPATGSSTGLEMGNAASTSVKILRRPPSETKSNKKQDDETGTKLNVNSQPFVPRSSLAPAIQLEDSTRTQFKPKLMILKRESATGSSKGGPDGNQRSNAGHTSKTYEEREADYLKARERILGPAASSSTSPSAESPASQVNKTSSSVPAPSCARPVQGQPEVPLLRQPQGPSVDGDRGFVRMKR